MRWGNLVFILIIVCIQNLAVSEEHGGGHASGSESAGEHGEKKVEAEYSGKQNQQWSEIQTKLGSLKTKVDAQAAVVKALEEASHHSHSASDSADKIAQLKKEHEKWQKLSDEYNALNKEYETKFPEKGLKESRIYKRIDTNSNNENEVDEASLPLERKLDKIHNKILKQYPKTLHALEEKKLKNKKSTSIKTSIDAKQKHHDGDPIQNQKNNKTSDDITESIILHK